MQKIFLISGALLGGLAVLLGAFGAHVLKAKLSPESLQIFETGVRYQFYHALALLLVALLSEKMNSSAMNYSGYFFIAGVILFSGSIYLLATREILGIDSWKSFLGPITPLGGLCFVSGWVLLLLAALKK